MLETSAENYTVTIENGQQVYPCRCGETHRGEWAIYDYGHHNCLHELPLITVDKDIPDYVMCPICGRTWTIEHLTPES